MNIIIYDKETREIYAIIPNELYCSNEDVILKTNLEIATETEEEFIEEFNENIYYKEFYKV